VNIAARVQELAVSRPIVVTGRVVENVQTSMLLDANNLKPVPRGTALRGIAEETIVYEIP
jgi:class 3 adenylate cyclase